MMILDLWEVEWIYKDIGTQRKIIAVSKDTKLSVRDILELPQFSGKKIISVVRVSAANCPVELIAEKHCLEITREEAIAILGGLSWAESEGYPSDGAQGIAAQIETLFPGIAKDNHFGGLL